MKKLTLLLLLIGFLGYSQTPFPSGVRTDSIKSFSGEVGILSIINFNGNIVKGLPSPTGDSDAIPKGYADTIYVKKPANSNTNLGVFSLDSIGTGGSNTSIGVYSGLNLRGGSSNNVTIGAGSMGASASGGESNYNTAIGFASLSQTTTGGFNTAIGTAALMDNTTGASNTAIGLNSLRDNTKGTHNTGLGRYSLASNEEGILNVAVGSGALQDIKNSDRNTAIGIDAMKGLDEVQVVVSRNAAFGIEALRSVNDARSNAAFGDNALSKLSVGNYNNAFGRISLFNLTDGNYNHAFGFNAGNGLTNGSYNVYIGKADASSANVNNEVRVADGEGNLILESDGSNGVIYAVNTDNTKLDNATGKALTTKEYVQNNYVGVSTNNTITGNNDFVGNIKFTNPVVSVDATADDELVTLRQVQGDSGWQNVPLNASNASSGTIQCKTIGNRLIIKGYFQTVESMPGNIIATLPVGYTPDDIRYDMTSDTNNSNEIKRVMITSTGDISVLNPNNSGNYAIDIELTQNIQD